MTLKVQCGWLVFSGLIFTSLFARAQIHEFPPKPSSTGQIIIQTSPDADVSLDDTTTKKASPQGRLVINNVKPGEHTLRISLAGKKDYGLQLNIVAGRTARVQAPLADLGPQGGPTLIVVHTKHDAQVYLDDIFKGQAGPEGRLVIENPNPGPHRLRISLVGEKDYEQQVSVVAGQTADVQATLVDLTGSVRVQTSVGAVVFFDDVSRGTADAGGQFVVQEVAPGTHEMRVSARGKKEFRQSITVLAGQESRIDVLLEDAGPTSGQVRENPKDGLKYVWIPPGRFMMGCAPGDGGCSSEEKPSHGVSITKGFWIGQTEVTVGAYKRFVGSAGRSMPHEPSLKGRIFKPGLHEPKLGSRALNPGWGNVAMPIVDVTWDEAQAYCHWAGGRLPTEAEWEYAAWGGSPEARYGPIDAVAWYADNSGEKPLDSTRIWNEEHRDYPQRLKDNANDTHKVGVKKANGLGLFDMLGNVWEWVNDWYNPNYYQTSPSQDPSGPATGENRVLRGGSWESPPKYVRISERFLASPDTRDIATGFRCAEGAVTP